MHVDLKLMVRQRPTASLLTSQVGSDANVGIGTDHSMHFTINLGDDYVAKPTSTGVPCPIIDLCIVSDGKVMPSGEVGEVWM